MAITIKWSKPTVVATYKNPKTQTTYNPQRTVSPQPVTYNPQPATYRPVQQTYNPQPAYRYVPPTYAVARAQQAARQRAIQAARIRTKREEQRKAKAEAARKLRVAQAKAQKQLKVKKEKTEMQRFAEWQSLNAKILAGMSVEDRVKLYFERSGAARGRDAETRKGLLDALTGGLFSQSAGRTEAQRMAGSLQGDVDSFEKRAKDFETEYGKREQRLKWLASNGTQAEFEAYRTEVMNWIQKQSWDLRLDAKRIEGLATGYEDYFNSPLKGWTADVGRTISKVNSASGGIMGKLWKYTLGSGGENIPSAVTAPRRAAAFVGNLFRSKGDKVTDLDGTERTYDGSPWKSTFNQSLTKQEQKKAFDYNAAKKLYSSDYEKYRAMQGSRFSVGPRPNEKIPAGLTKKQFYEARWEIDQNSAVAMSRVRGFLADPLLLAGSARKGFSAIKSTQTATNASAKVMNAIKGSKAFNTVNNSRAASAVRWLGKDYVAPKSAATLKAAQKALPHWTAAKVAAGKISRSYKVAGDSTRNKFKAWKGIRSKEAKRYADLFAGKDEKVIYLAQQLLFNKAHNATNIYSKSGFRVNVGTKLNPRIVDFSGMTKEQIRSALRLRDHLEEFGSHYYNTERQLGASMRQWYRSQAASPDRETMKGLRYAPRNAYIPNRPFTDSTSRVKKAFDKLKVGHLIGYKGRYLQDPQRLARSLAQRDYSHKLWKHTYVDNPKFTAAMRNKASDMGLSVKTAKDIRAEGVPTIRGTFKNILQRPDSWRERSLADKAAFAGTAAYDTIGKFPMKLWKASVLALRPAWAVNNIGWNTAAGTIAAGPRFLWESAKMLKRGNLTAARQANPQVISKLPQYFGAKNNPLYRPASAAEDWARLSTYNALKARGFSDEAALKRLNTTLFDYSTKNWEVPFKAISPFWAWHKGLAKLSVKAPYKYPLSSKLFNENDKRNERAWADIPEDSRQYYQGRQYLWNDKDGNPQFMNTPWNPMSQGEFSNMSLNPFLNALAQIAEQRDHYGNKLDDKRIWSVFANQFPQVPLARKAFDAYKMSRGDLDTAVKYFSEVGSQGYPLTKSRQGYDQEASNYKSELDPRHKLGDKAWAYFGRPSVSKFDKAKNDYYTRLSDFNKSYFDIDWESKYPDYNKRVKAQEAHAKKYGFDLYKDIYDDAWSRNDTEFTKGIKAKKAEARSYLEDFWKEYEKQPYGSKGIWVRNKMKEITDSKVLASNRFIANGLPDWHSPDSVARADRAEFWQTYWSADKATRRLLMQSNPKYVNFSYQRSQKQIDYLAAKSSGDWSDFHTKYGFRSEKQRMYYEAKKSGDWSKFEARYGSSFNRSKARSEAQKFWTKFFKSTPDERKKLLAANPQYDKFKDEAPKTQEEWEKIMRDVKQARKERLLSDSRGRSFYNARLSDARAEQPKIDRWLNTKRKKITWA